MINSLHCIVYVSSASWILADEDLENILKDAREDNKIHAITGALLYNDGTFFQYIEGPYDNLMKIYQKIKNSQQHRGMIELLSDKISERRFPDWYMGFFEPSKSDLLNIANKIWWHTVHYLDNKSETEGLQLLDVFCKSNSHMLPIL